MRSVLRRLERAGHGTHPPRVDHPRWGLRSTRDQGKLRHDERGQLLRATDDRHESVRQHLRPLRRSGQHLDRTGARWSGRHRHLRARGHSQVQQSPRRRDQDPRRPRALDDRLQDQHLRHHPRPHRLPRIAVSVHADNHALHAVVKSTGGQAASGTPDRSTRRAVENVGHGVEAVWHRF